MAGLFAGKKQVLKGELIEGGEDGSEKSGSSIRLLGYRPLANFLSTTSVTSSTSTLTSSSVHDVTRFQDIPRSASGGNISQWSSSTASSPAKSTWWPWGDRSLTTGSEADQESISSDSRDESRIGRCPACLRCRLSNADSFRYQYRGSGHPPSCTFPRRASDVSRGDSSSVTSEGGVYVRRRASADTLYKHGTEDADIDSDGNDDVTNTSSDVSGSNNFLRVPGATSLNRSSTLSEDLVEIIVYNRFGKTKQSDDSSSCPEPDYYIKKVSRGRPLDFDISDGYDDEDDDYGDYGVPAVTSGRPPCGRKVR